MADPTVDPFGGLTGDSRDAYAAMLNMLQAYGLQSLAPTVLGYIQQGYSNDTISVLLPTTDAYKQRFSANDARVRAGLPVLTPAQYLSVEDSYRQIMSAAGLPAGFYDQPSDFTSWIAQDVSPTEVQQRVQVASSMVNNLDPAAKQAFSQWYSQGDMVAYALDQSRAVPLLERQWNASVAAGAATGQGLSINQTQAEQVGALGLSADQARSGFGQAAEMNRNVGVLSGIYDGNYTQGDAVNDVFFSNDSAQLKRKTLASQERAQFGGSSATQAQSLTSRKNGQV